ncbi:unnamed protein product, partial [Choristocarpus tenellus]
SCSLDGLRETQRAIGRGVITDITYEVQGKISRTGQPCSDVFVSGYDRDLPVGLRVQGVEDALRSRVLLVDRSHWGLISVKGEDRLRFLHSQSTNNFEGAVTGEIHVIPACIVTNTGRMVDYCECVVLPDEIKLLCSPNRWQTLLETFNKFIFPMDRVTVTSASEETAIFTIAGPEALEKLLALGCSANPAPGKVLTWTFNGEEVRVLGSSNLEPLEEGERLSRKENFDSVTEYTLLVPSAVAAELWEMFASVSCLTLAGEDEWQFLRIKQGIPFAGKELTKDYNPLQAGLWHSVHFDKGCYIGQETISRVNAYNAVKSQLFGVVFTEGGEVEEGTILFLEGAKERAGVVTSMMDLKMTSKCQGLAYVNKKTGGVGLKVSLVVTEGGVTGRIFDIPYPTRSDVESAQPPVKKASEEAKEQTGQLEDEVAKEASRKAAKLEAMQKKLDALKAARKKTAS